MAKAATYSFNSYRRQGPRPGSNAKEIGVKVADCIEDMMKVFAIRAAVYIAEQECPYQEEFDGNDFSGSHLLGFVGDEPVGCLRIRYFADFAKLERLAVRKEYRRKSRLSFLMARAALDLCRMKGYRRIYGHARDSLVPFWSRFGFRPVDHRNGKVVFSDFNYTEMIAEPEPDPDAIGLHSDPYVLIRPEGTWNQPGVLDRSAIRAASHA